MSVVAHSVDRSRAIRISLLVAVSVLVALAGFNDALRELVVRWIRQDEYSHGFLIPVIAVGLLWARRAALIESVGPPSWWGPVVVLIAALMHITGELSAFFMLAQLGFIVALLGICFGSFGGLFNYSLKWCFCFRSCC